MFPHPYNQNKDTPQGNYGYPKLIINDEISQQQKSDSAQSEPNYNYPVIEQAQQPVYQPPLYQQPYSQPYQQLYQQPIQQPYQQPCQQQYQQPLLQQQPIYINPQNNQVVPDVEQLYNQNNGMNQGQNKRFGLFVTAVWAILQLLDYFMFYYAIYHGIPYQLGILCMILMFLIPLIVFQFKESQTGAISVFLFLAFISSGVVATLGFFYIFGEIYGFYIVFQYYQMGTMITAFVYLLQINSKPSAIAIIKLTTVVLAISLFYILYLTWYKNFYDSVFLIIFYLIIWFFCCSLLSHMLVNTLDKIYQGQNKKIQRDNIWIGYILFKLYFFIPGI